MATEVRHLRKERSGVVVSDAMNKTVVVQVERRMAHPLYGKVIKSHKKYVAHDETNEAHKGDRVRIVETRPMSKTKHWRLVEIVSKAAGSEVSP
ncbi:MAG: 30S ribosomal protein S17 [Kiritimatiellia bacterium]|jgi:small subunit ribosomal protein S17|nr:30S ribosomal protein S17 [Kiritimatiellia bacterium]